MGLDRKRKMRQAVPKQVDKKSGVPKEGKEEEALRLMSPLFSC